MYKRRSLKELYRIAKGEGAPCCEKKSAEKSCSGGVKMDSCCGVKEIAGCDEGVKLDSCCESEKVANCCGADMK